MFTVVHELWVNKGVSSGLFYRHAHEDKDAIHVIMLNTGKQYTYKPRMALELEDGTIETEPNLPSLRCLPSLSVSHLTGMN